MKNLKAVIICFIPILLLGQSGTEKLKLWATYYYVPSFEHDEEGIHLLNEQGAETGLQLSLCEWCSAAIEGTVFIKKGDQHYVLNYAGRSDELQTDCRQCPKYKTYEGYRGTGKVLWEFSSGYGRGVRNYHLVPYITIAVDPSVIPIGSVVYIPQAKGLEYQNAEGQTVAHDGYFFAGDTGGMIKGSHVDVFIGPANNEPFDFIRSNPRETFEAYLVTDETIRARLKSYHE